MTTIYMIRHAEAEGNLYRRGQGHFDGKITRRGHIQIAALAERFRAVPLDALYASDLSRTVTTAGAILKYHDLPLIKRTGLREINMGAWENQAWGNLSRYEPEMLEKFSHDPEQWFVPGAESFAHLTGRITEAVTQIAQAHPGQSVAVVSHGLAIRALLCGILRVPSNEVSRVRHGDNTAVSQLLFDDSGFQVAYMNDNSHLSQEISTFFRNQSKRRGGGDFDDSNLRFEPLDLAAESALYLDCYRDAWRCSHGDDRGFDGAACLKTARMHAAAHPLALMKAYRGEAFAGLVELAPEHGESENFGWITLCYVTPEEREQGLGVQLLGHAISVYRKMGRMSLRLNVAPNNERARRFYERYEFSELGLDRNARGSLLLEKML